jgi:prepilin peptidase CpaA
VSGGLLTIAIVLSVLTAAAAAVTDFRTGHIPNWISGSAFLAGVAIQSLAGHRGYDWWSFGGSTAAWGFAHAILGALVCGLFPYLLFRKQLTSEDGDVRRVGGGGDVKVFAGIGALLGMGFGIEAEFFAICVAGVLGMARLAWHGRLLASMTNTLFIGLNPVLPRSWRREIRPELLTTVRMGGAILIGTVLAALSNKPL